MLIIPVKEDLLKEVAYAYYYQGTEIQYDQKNNRREVNSTPEDATGYMPIFLDCSSYVNSVYHYLYGINIVDSPTTAEIDKFAKNNIDTNNEVIYYIDVKNYTDSASQSAILQEIWNNLQIGDLVCYRHNSSGSVGGHVMLYIGDNTFLHCTGSSFTYKDDPSQSSDGATTIEKNNGAIQILAASEVFSNTSSSRYLFSTKSGSEVLTFEVLRPFNREGLEFTSQALLRYKLKGLSYEKSASPSHMATVSRGSEITYVIEVKNNTNKEVKNVKIEDVIPTGTTYKDGSATNSGIYYSNGTIKWNVTVGANATVYVSYTVTVSNDVVIGSMIESIATIGGVYTNKVYHTVGAFNDSDYDTIKTKALALVGTDYSSDTSDGFKMALDLYYNAFGKYFVDSNTTATNIVNKLIYDNRDNNAIDKTCSYYPLVNPNFYGGLLIRTGQIQDIERIRIYKSAYFAPGDVIVLHNSFDSKKHTYIFVDSSTIIGLDNNGKVAKLYSTTNAVETFVSQLIAYNRFVVLRPALSFSK